ncbi:MAG: tryptophan synthase subunit alpha [Lachnospiraceae bacterium]|jgi:tryptophan synthase alpha chain|nr:tryptophan synthase subunit alpha [Lachnospiraceae bacterium]HBV82563.1 tryptophan synthase subunit alpha [Lachnospiraceae bacterium]
MSRIGNAFNNKKAFIVFVTGGDPDIETTEALIPQMSAAGVDLIEIGIPFSDPIAEGVIIQAADERALKAGTTTDKLFDMVKHVRKKVDIPLVFMTYINPIYTYGTERFVERCAACGIDGIIVLDVPFEEKEEINGACEAAGIELISMITPTSKERVDMIARQAKGFLYCVSSIGVSKIQNKIKTNIKEMVDNIKQASDIPCVVGFDTATPNQAYEMAAISDGTIVESAIVKIIAQNGKNCIEPVCQYVRDMKAAMASV